jgi:hypothetical protein
VRPPTDDALTRGGNRHMTSEEAKAVSEVAKTTGKALEIVQGTGGWLKGIFGTLPEDLVGLVGADWVHEKRRRTIAPLQANTAEFIAALPPDRLTEPSPSVVLPLLQSAADEARPELQARWAALLANAMTDEGRNVRRAFFETLAKMEPADAVVLDVLVSAPVAPEVDLKWIAEKAFTVGLSSTEVGLSMGALVDLKCGSFLNDFAMDQRRTKRGEPKAASPGPFLFYEATVYGRALAEACSPPRPN